MQERRQAPRTRVRKSAQFIFEPDHSVLNCVVCDLSSAGAFLQIPTLPELPEHVELSFDSFRSARRCRVQWRTENNIGVSFS